MHMLPISPTLAWDLGTFLDNAAKTLKSWGGLFFVLIGMVMLIIGIYKIASGLISHGKKQVEWVPAIVLILVGGALAAFGGNAAWKWISDIASGGKKTINDLGGNTIMLLPWLSLF